MSRPDIGRINQYAIPLPWLICPLNRHHVCRYNHAHRSWKNWKGIRQGQDGEIQLYDLSNDVGEERNVAAQQPKVVQHIARIMRTAPTPSDRYPIGRIYKGQPLWKPEAYTHRTSRLEKSK